MGKILKQPERMSKKPSKSSDLVESVLGKTAKERAGRVAAVVSGGAAAGAGKAVAKAVAKKLAQKKRARDYDRYFPFETAAEWWADAERKYELLKRGAGEVSPGDKATSRATTWERSARGPKAVGTRTGHRSRRVSGARIEKHAKGGLIKSRKKSKSKRDGAAIRGKTRAKYGGTL